MTKYKPYMPFTSEELATAIADGLVTERFHNEYPYRILNYSEKAAFDHVWTPVTLHCRGLILDDDFNVVARGFKKFFNLSQPEAPEYMSSDYVYVTDKADGSLGILYPTPDGGHAIATRGSFHSDQAEHATKVWNEKYEGRVEVSDNLTMLFEIIYKDNRIVLDYGDMDDLILLGAMGLDFRTSQVLPAKHLVDVRWASGLASWDGPVVKDFGSMQMSEVLDIPDRPNAEGLVIHHRKGMAKVKQEDYLILHRLRFEMTPKRIWESLAAGLNIEEIVAPLPDEFQEEILTTAKIFNLMFKQKEKHIFDEWDKVQHLEFDRKAFAQAAVQLEHRAALFSLLDNKDIAPYIWKLIKPVTEKK